MKTWPFNVHPNQSYIAGTFVGFSFMVVGCMTLYYPPSYFDHVAVWGGIFIFAGMLTLGALLYPSKLFAAIAGGFTVGASLFRSFAVFKQLGVEDTRRGLIGDLDTASGYITFGVMWFMIAALLWLGWPIMAAGLLQGKDDPVRIR